MRRLDRKARNAALVAEDYKPSRASRQLSQAPLDGLGRREAVDPDNLAVLALCESRDGVDKGLGILWKLPAQRLFI
ncbi:MAG TPA: hypothetical protein VKT80_12515, partial [Chloroflexota bacterium]|nr:hypothetical protein [Chloroflexota bacterium]